MSHLAILKGIDSPNSSSDEWFTPRSHFDEWDREFRFNLDPAATAESAKCRRFFTKLQNGLVQSWVPFRVFCNPPYSDITPWVVKAYGEMIAGCELVVMLLPANKTEQPWWQRYVEPFRDGRDHPAVPFRLETRFIARRLVHGSPGDPEGTSRRKGRANGGTFGSVLVVWKARRP